MEMHKTKVYRMYLYNATTTLHYQPRQLKFRLLRAISKHAIISLRVHNIIRGIIYMCEYSAMKCFQCSLCGFCYMWRLIA